jgi:capsular polysaccharide biosynthesis protein
MFEAQYAKEPFDLRLTILRLIRNFHIILLVTILGTLVFGGGYYVKNVLLMTAHSYEATATYKVEYTDEPSKSGDYYINEMSWNTYVKSDDFLGALTESLSSFGINNIDEVSLEEMLSASLASDIHVPTLTVVCGDRDECIRIERAVEETFTGYFADSNPQIKSIAIIDSPKEASEVEPDVRPLRAFVLSALLTFFAAIVVFLLYEIGNDGIWLPATIRKRYGIKCAGTMESVELAANIQYLFNDVSQAAVCNLDDSKDPYSMAEKLGTVSRKTTWIPMPAPLMCPESAASLKSVDGVLLAVPAGSMSGKKLERIMEFFAEQDIRVTAAILDDADEWIIRKYYMFNPNKGYCTADVQK